MRAPRKTASYLGVLGQPWWRKGTPLPNTSPSRALSCSTSKCESLHRILKSPPLLSVDLPDIWDSVFTHSDPPPPPPPNEQYCDKKTARIIDGKLIAEEILSDISIEVRRMKESVGRVPGLAVILVGQRRDSLTYVRNKMVACEDAGFRYMLTELPENCSEDDVCNALTKYNNDSTIQGVIVQLPLPKHLDEGKILSVLKLEKDVDGLHPLNIGSLAMRGREPLFIPCTPKGCIELLLRSDVELMGKKAVVIGRSNIVGLPAFLLLQRHHTTVSMVHAFSENPEKIAREADILVTAAGCPNLVRESWIKPGAIVLDVGTNPIEDPSTEYGYRLTGDVCYEEALPVASAITPVPGGVGPMTIAMLLFNTLESAKRAFNFT